MTGFYYWVAAGDAGDLTRILEFGPQTTTYSRRDAAEALAAPYQGRLP